MLLFSLFSNLVLSGNFTEDCLTSGLNIYTFNDYDFKELSDRKSISKINFSGKFDYKSYIVNGTFCPPVSGLYRFRVQASTSAEIVFQKKVFGRVSNSKICDSDERVIIQTENFKLLEQVCYPITISYKTGCKSMNSYLILETAYDRSNDFSSELKDFMTCSWSGCKNGRPHNRCSMKSSDSHSPKCKKGIFAQVYNNEFFGSPGKSFYIDSTFEFNYVYSSIIFTGSVMVPEDGEYRLRLKAYPFSQITFHNSVSPESLGPPGSCGGQDFSYHLTESAQLRSNKAYPFQIRMRTGCGLYSNGFYLEWKNGPKYGGIDNAPWEKVPSSVLFDCTRETCAEGLYGPYCDGVCNCSENGICSEGVDGNGTCFCKNGYYGSTCDDECSLDSHCGPNQYCQDGECFCKPGYYGTNCELDCKSNADCGNNQRCNDGVCVCKDGFYGENCTADIYYGKPNISSGITRESFRNEISFINRWEFALVPNAVKEPFEWAFSSIAVYGSIVPPHTGYYRFYLRGKPYVQLQFDWGSKKPNIIGPAGCCLNSIHTDITTDKYYLLANRTYAFSFWMRTGCALISNYYYLRWQDYTKYRSMKTPPWEFIPDKAYFNTTKFMCANGTFGPDCQGVCPKCPANSYCSQGPTGTGECLCKEGYHGVNCDLQCMNDDNCPSNQICKYNRCICGNNFYGENCTEYCDRNVKCNGHGACDLKGNCVCEDGYSGEFCNITSKSITEGVYGISNTKSGLANKGHVGFVIFAVLSVGVAAVAILVYTLYTKRSRKQSLIVVGSEPESYTK